EIGWPGARRGVGAGLERIAPAAAQSLRQVPLGAAAGEREAEHRVAGEMIIEPGRIARGARSEVVTADHSRIASGLVVAAVASSPHAPARFVRQWRSFIDRRLHHLGISERYLLGQVRPIGGKAERRPASRLLKKVFGGPSRATLIQCSSPRRT